MNKCELSVVVSALNEERNVDNLFRRLKESLGRSGINWEIVFLDNHSTDNTGNIADSYASTDKRIHVVHRRNMVSKDLGSSLREGFRNCSGDYILIMDADLSHDPDMICRLFSHRKDADIIIGSRFVRGGRSDMPFTRVMISRIYNLLSGVLTGAGVRDMTTGFKLYRKRVIDSINLTNDGFGLHVEILLKAVNSGFSTKEIPIHYRMRTNGESKLIYRKQFKTYAKPVINMLKSRLMRI